MPAAPDIKHLLPLLPKSLLKILGPKITVKKTMIIKTK
jgi:hypothetical protein